MPWKMQDPVEHAEHWQLGHSGRRVSPRERGAFAATSPRPGAQPLSPGVPRAFCFGELNLHALGRAGCCCAVLRPSHRCCPKSFRVCGGCSASLSAHP